MRFGPVPLDDALGAILAHSQPVSGGRIRKGHPLDAPDIDALRAEGLLEVVVAQLDPDDVGEDAAAERLAHALVPNPAAVHLRLGRAATGRVNLHATKAGILDLDSDAVGALNALDPNVTVATLPPLARVSEGQMVATVKIISYAVPKRILNLGEREVAGALGIRPVRARRATLIITDLGTGPGKGEAAIARRLDRLGIALDPAIVVAHDTGSIAQALSAAEGDLLLILTASATSDIADVGPSGLVDAGGTLSRFGMPVDPGNLLFLGDLGGRAVIGLPGCARSPALNGADWVLERVACGHIPDAAEFAAMGVGGLLKEPPSRPHPRDRR
ncbi:molybdopterin-binding protein [Palleronia sp. LCG004]|uniref:molybdopterin-binding protein n=1 Tax=Palleronia sp. LCG004 TaxID=3079304 RepID=UPI002942DAAE|nr:molybdopterin-binding protein [Palleronia sp. LCG004]WOI57313.1 molybdopterin-binding protein [Palleronia sp. LCG004]